MTNLVQTCLSIAQQGSRVLDLGSGNGRIAAKLAGRGAQVIAVDRVQQSEPLDGVTFISAEVVDFVERLPAAKLFDLILLRNLIQFLYFEIVVEQLLPKLQSHLRPGGYIAIGTFYRDPDPPFDRPAQSVYTLNDLRQFFTDWTEVFADERKELMNDLRGKERLFFVTELIFRRP